MKSCVVVVGAVREGDEGEKGRERGQQQRWILGSVNTNCLARGYDDI